MKKFFLLILLTLSLGAMAKETLKIYMPFAPGGMSDPIGRKIQKHIMDNYPDLDVVLIFKPGGEGIVAFNEFLSDSSKNVLYASATSLIFKAAESDQLAQNVKKIKPVIPFAIFNTVISSSKTSNIKTWQDLINESKHRVVNIGAFGVMQRIWLQEYFKNNPNITIVPYAGETPQLLGLLNGSVEIITMTTSGHMANAIQHNVNPIAVTGDTAIAGIPPLTNFGISKNSGSGWLGFFAKPNASTEDVQFFNKIIKEALQQPDLVEWYTTKYLGIPKNTSVRDFEKQVNDDINRIIK